MSYYCNLLVVGAEGSGKSSLIKTLMKHEDLVAKLPIPWYSKKIGEDGGDQSVIKCNLWEIPGGINRMEKLQGLIIWPRVTSILFLVSLGDQKALESLDHWSALLQEMGWDGSRKRAIVVGSYLNKSPLTSKVKDRVLQWCLDHDDCPFLEFSLGEKSEIGSEGLLDWWGILSYFLDL